MKRYDWESKFTWISNFKASSFLINVENYNIFRILIEFTQIVPQMPRLRLDGFTFQRDLLDRIVNFSSFFSPSLPLAISVPSARGYNLRNDAFQSGLPAGRQRINILDSRLRARSSSTRTHFALSCSIKHKRRISISIIMLATEGARPSRSRHADQTVHDWSSPRKVQVATTCTKFAN